MVAQSALPMVLPKVLACCQHGVSCHSIDCNQDVSDENFDLLTGTFCAVTLAARKRIILNLDKLMQATSKPRTNNSGYKLDTSSDLSHRIHIVRKAPVGNRLFLALQRLPSDSNKHRIERGGL